VKNKNWYRLKIIVANGAERKVNYVKQKWDRLISINNDPNMYNPSSKSGHGKQNSSILNF
jgi:hypothetical protein